MAFVSSVKCEKYVTAFLAIRFSIASFLLKRRKFNKEIINL